jgi:hypothetical protein
LGAGVASAAVATWLFVHGRNAEAARMDVTPTIGDRGVGLVVLGRF